MKFTFLISFKSVLEKFILLSMFFLNTYSSYHPGQVLLTEQKNIDDFEKVVQNLANCYRILGLSGIIDSEDKKKALTQSNFEYDKALDLAGQMDSDLEITFAERSLSQHFKEDILTDARKKKLNNLKQTLKKQSDWCKEMIQQQSMKRQVSSSSVDSPSSLLVGTGSFFKFIFGGE